MLWLAVTVLDRRSIDSQEMHGPFDNIEALGEALAECTANARSDGYRAIPVVIDLCSEDVPEIVELPD